MSVGEAPHVDPPYRIEETDQPGVYAVVADIEGRPVRLAVVRADGPVTAEDVATVLARPEPAELVGLARVVATSVAALDEEVNGQLREVWLR